jgi:hypothetical protein
VQAHAPEHAVPGGLPTEALIAQIIVAKFADHLPLYRQAEIFRRQGVDLDRTTLGNRVGRACFHLKPVVERMRVHLAGAARLFMDETPLPVLDPGRKETKRGFFWAMAADGLGAVGVSRRTRPVDGFERTDAGGAPMAGSRRLSSSSATPQAARASTPSASSRAFAGDTCNATPMTATTGWRGSTGPRAAGRWSTVGAMSAAAS